MSDSVRRQIERWRECKAKERSGRNRACQDRGSSVVRPAARFRAAHMARPSNSQRRTSFSSANLGAVQGPPDEYRLVRQGRAQVLTKIQGVRGAVLAGSRVLEGEVSQGSFVRISRNRRALWTGRIRQLRLGAGGDLAVAGRSA
jgi:hypothetical protein